MACENNLFIHFDNFDKKQYFLNRFQEHDKLFESLIPLHGTKLECYGTDSDVYFDFITFDICDESVINLVFFTNEYPCIPFCKKICGLYNVSIELVYLNQDNNFSGKFCMHLQQITKNEVSSYWQGLYNYYLDIFWENIPSLLETYNGESTFTDFLHNNNLFLSEDHFIEISHKFDEILLFNQFKRL